MRLSTHLALLGSLITSGLAAPLFKEASVDYRSGLEDGVKFQDDDTRAVVGYQLSRRVYGVQDRLTFELQVLESETTCGSSTILLDGRKLPLIEDGDEYRGEGSILTAYSKDVFLSWTLKCAKWDDKESHQALDIRINSIDGEEVGVGGLMLLFQQKDVPKIINVKPFATSDLISVDRLDELPLEDEIVELQYMKAQLEELQHLIRQKQQLITLRRKYYKPSLSDCDSLVCIIETLKDSAKLAVKNIMGKIADDSEESFPHWPGHHGKKPGNHTCGHPPKHGNHTHPPHRRPHLPLPICRYPPPRRRPDHRRPPHDGEKPHPPPPHHRPHDEDQALFQEGPPHRRPEQGPLPHHRRRHIFPLVATLITFALLLKFLHRRFFLSPAASLRRQTRRAERHQRRALRRVARKERFAAFLTRLRQCRFGSQPCTPDANPEDEDEKLSSLMEKYAVDDDNDDDARTVDDEIEGFREAARLVDDMISLRSVEVRRREEEEELPAYEEGGGSNSELGSVVDGCMYTPGSSDYTPSEAGAASDILGPDMKR